MGFKSVSVQDAAQSISNGAMIVDVREQDEFDQAHLENAILVPLSSTVS